MMINPADRKNVILVSDFDTSGSGYSAISGILGNELQKNYNVIGLGISYNHQQHDWHFGVSQIPPQQVPSAIASIHNATGVRDVLIVMDIPYIEKVIEVVKREQKAFEGMQISGIFAVEADPLLNSWAMSLMKLDHRFPISQFGEDVCREAGVESKHIPIPIDLNVWKQRTEDEQIAIKEALGYGAKTLFFFNGDGNERKNTSALYEAMVQVIKVEPAVHLLILTRKDSPAGWRLDDLADMLSHEHDVDLRKHITVVDKGIPKNDVWKMYAGADFYIQAVKAEGLCLPVLEALAVGVPVIATDCTALSEHIRDGRGTPMKYDFVHIDCFGNGHRYWVFPNHIAEYMLSAIRDKRRNYDFSKQIANARKYVEDRKVEDAVSLLKEVLEEE